MPTTTRKLLPLLAIVACTGLTAASTQTAARPLTTDRPDATESPYTVEPGRVQLEISAADYTRDKNNPARDGTRTETWSVAPLNIRIGLTASTELQLVYEPHIIERVKDRALATTTTERGAGDLTLRYKLNLANNQADGSPAWGLMPYVKLPTADDALGNGNVEGGLIVPFAMDLSGGWGFGAMTELAVVRNAADTGHRAAWLNTATVARDLTDRVGVFFETTALVGEGKPALTANTGFTVGVTDDLQFDAGVNFGLTRAADDLTVFAGLAWRY
ncbi:MAG: transporter [Verrucomicrobiota bacterium]